MIFWQVRTNRISCVPAFSIVFIGKVLRVTWSHGNFWKNVLHWIGKVLKKPFPETIPKTPVLKIYSLQKSPKVMNLAFVWPQKPKITGSHTPVNTLRGTLCNSREQKVVYSSFKKISWLKPLVSPYTRVRKVTTGLSVQKVIKTKNYIRFFCVN